mmetsp:Transcript_32039/g.70119  ORF Transcript_32039/g.70119 Transcript_32039/m.70119 type:complete len:191 (+) Transcript_32039:925-1497(+)
MRHGVHAPRGVETADSGAEAAAPGRLGCYFCNDVVAPANSTLRRTLDQQCTVSRPGLSMLASAMAVELMVSLLHHPHGASAEADADVEGRREAHAQATQSPLGLVPHQVRGFLSAFRSDCMVGRAFDKCTACSAAVLSAHEAQGFDFLLSAFNRAAYLEELTGLSQMHREAEAALESLEFFGDDEADEDF